MEPLSMDRVFRVLSEERRRRVLLALARPDPGGEPTVLVPEDVREDDDLGQLQLSLVHVHLPILEGCGLVQWDRDGRTVTRGPQFDQIVPFLKDVAALDE